MINDSTASECTRSEASGRVPEAGLVADWQEVHYSSGTAFAAAVMIRLDGVVVVKQSRLPLPRKRFNSVEKVAVCN